MESTINSSTAFRPLRWICGAAVAVVVAYLVGVGSNAPITPQCPAPPTAATPTR